MGQLSGMTGFARVSGEAEWGHWAWEAKSVNGRGLDVRINTPPGFDGLERALKAKAAKLFNRGSMQIALRIDVATSDSGLAVNAGALDAMVEAWCARTGLQDIGPDALATLMTTKGILEVSNSNIRDLALDDDVMTALEEAGAEALADLQASRMEEGASLAYILGDVVAEMETVAEAADKLAGTHPSLLKARLEKQLAELEADTKVDAERLAAELALSAAKADVREELDRLRAHFETAHAHLAAGSPIGRKLDFLAQELNREANTLCSKSISLDLTNAGLSLKGLIDQFKEQAANVE